MNFTPLHVYSGYSYLKSGLKLEEYVSKAKKLGFASLSLTDFNNMTAVPHFASLCEKEGIKPLVGEDLLISDSLLTFIVKNETGYRNLLYINYLSKKKHLKIEEAKLYQEGLIIILPTKSRLYLEISENKSFSRLLAKFAKGIDDFYLGLEEDDLPKMDKVREFAYSHGYSLVAFPSVKYLNKEDEITLRILESIETKDVLSEKKAIGKDYLKDVEEIKKIYEANEIEETNKISDAISFKVVIKRGKMTRFTNPLGLTSDEYLKKVTFENLKKLSLDKDEYVARLNEELNVIKSMGYSDYFLVVSDYVNKAKSLGIIVGPGRGSAVGSLVSYLLNITSADPIKYGLIFERFLNKERQTMPDIDIDFEDTRREEVVKYLIEKYGNEKVSKIIAVQKFGAKQALGDIGRVFNYERRDIELFTKLIKKDEDKLTLRDLYKKNPDFKKLVNEDKYYLEIVSLASKIEGLPRQSGLHAAGIVINDEPLTNVLPLDIENDGSLVAELEKDYLEEQSFLKMDLLSIRNLTIVKDCLERIKKSYGVSLSIDEIPYNDEKAIKLIASDKVMGLFQLESTGMRNAIKEIKPTCLEDIVAVISLYRPGPMQNIKVYAERKNKHLKVEYISNALKEILEPTYGIIVYQEQIMQIANKMAGFSYGEADLLRRAISKKDSKKLSSYQAKFVSGAIQNGYEKVEAENVYKLIYKFGDYGFNKSHALGYAMLTMKMAYLKAKYPKEFYASILTNSNSSNFLSTISEMKHSGLNVLKPDINKSSYAFIDDGNDVIYPLSGIKGVMSQNIVEIIHERNYGPYQDFFDFVVRMNKYKINPKIIMSLIDSGAFDSLYPSRQSLRVSIPIALNYASMVMGDSGETILDLEMFPKPKMNVANDDELENLNKEYDVLGIMLSGSPLLIAKSKLTNIKLVNIENIPSSKGEINVACLFRNIRSVTTKKGQPMAFAQIYDENSEMEITIFTDAYQKSIKALKKNNIVIVNGSYSYNRHEFNVNYVTSLEDLKNE